jgi:hypothetical protein
VARQDLVSRLVEKRDVHVAVAETRMLENRDQKWNIGLDPEHREHAQRFDEASDRRCARLGGGNDLGEQRIVVH